MLLSLVTLLSFVLQLFTNSLLTHFPFSQFMDVFDPHHICNHSDDQGRYSFTVRFPSSLSPLPRSKLTLVVYYRRTSPP